MIRQRWLQGAVLSLFILCGLLFFQKQPTLPDSYIGQDVSVILQAMPRKDRRNLEYFFQQLVRDEYFAYVFLGVKPMALGTLWSNMNPFACFWEQFPSTNQELLPSRWEQFLFYLQEAMSSHRIQLNKGYQTWIKYQKFFPSTQHCFFYENRENKIANCLIIGIIHKEKFAHTLEKYHHDFEAVLNCKMNAEELLNERIYKPFLSTVLRNHDGLIGTLLGYGRDHAFWYHQKFQLHSTEEKEAYCRQCHIPFPSTAEIGAIWTDEEQLQFQEEKQNWLTQMWTYPPSFRADRSTAEAIYLRKQYLETRNQIRDYYAGKDFLEATLTLLTSSATTNRQF